MIGQIVQKLQPFFEIQDGGHYAFLTSVVIALARDDIQSIGLHSAVHT